MRWGPVLGLGIGAAIVYAVTRDTEPVLRTTPGKPSGPLPRVGEAGRAIGIRPDMTGVPSTLLAEPDMAAPAVRPLVHGEPLVVMATMTLPDGSVFLRVRPALGPEGFIPSVWFEPTGQRV